ncbi:toll/interleukin-1 receptor domain-containing protein [Sphingomonas sp. SM33]|uniref:Toll/interleukin-1 receptor domain-containing protein n=1 Tax=Sphingomonas telluris TaxID=2907998 RepID=A0ABS9VJX4_9SPHN|nr:toll/interleukin-1 receptor domain-containing protein [Sphingomonas telluris]MCH8614844.1 toll/interleukin-1 receptor domain-containing protein [Sphingomonas telluris]
MTASTSDQEGTCFLSYARSDEHFALRFANDLRSLGASTWMDQLDLRPSQHWDRAIERAIRACSSVIVILSPRSVASENVADEIGLAIDCGKPVIPVMIEPCDLPLRITRMHLIDATRDYQAALTECFASIAEDRGNPKSFSEPARELGGIHEPEVIASATRQLATVVGPIAQILVKKAASEAASVERLYDLLSLHIQVEDERERFMDSAPQRHIPSGNLARSTEAMLAAAKGVQINGDDLERLGKILSSYLGPVGILIARRERKACGSLRDFRQRLATTLRNRRDREEFSRRAELDGASHETAPPMRLALQSGG